MSRAPDITSQRFGKLTVLRRSERRLTGRSKPALWVCQCECGNTTEAIAADLRNGRRVSCGCQQVFNVKRGTGKTKQTKPKFRKGYFNEFNDDNLLDAEFDFERDF